MTTTPTVAEKITKTEREELRGVLKARSRLTKKLIEHRASEILAGVEERLATEYKIDAANWRDLTAAAKEAVEQADAELARRCRDLGIPEQFRPKIDLSWYSRGENAFSARRAELRRVAVTRVNEMAKLAQIKMESKTLDGLELLARSALESDAAQEFMASMPSVESLMPALDVSALGPLALPAEEDDEFE